MKKTVLMALVGCIVISQTFNEALAESGWITDPANGCTFFNPNPQPNESIKFEGVCTKKNAKGRLIWFENEQVNEIAEGQWVDGKQTGKGTYKYIKSGSSFQGTYVDGKAFGKGTFTWASGNSYVGDFVAGKRTGKGTFTWASGNSYVGDFVAGKQTGKGTYKNVNGFSYVGDHVDGKSSGKGTVKWPNGDSYVGDFLDGKRTGKGVLIMKGEKGDMRYEGDFLNDKFHGFGQLNIPNVLRYVGQFLDDDWSGKGVMYLSNGRKFEGNFAKNVAIGDGVLILENGERIEGRHENGSFVANDENLDHRTCVKLGFTSSTPDYAVCRTQIEMAKRKTQDDERNYRSQLLEQQRRYEEERKDAALLQGLTALGVAANILRPPPRVTSSMHTYTMPNGRTFTCDTFGSFTTCN